MKYPIAGLATALLLITSLDARAGVDVEVDLNARVKVTHDPEFDVERFRFEATKGTRLNITVAGVGRRSTLDLNLRLSDPFDADVDLGSAARFVDRNKRVIVKGLVVEKTGEYELEVTATGTGPYSVRLTGAPQRTWPETIEDLGVGLSTTVDFSAPDGARITFRGTAPRVSNATPRFTDFLGGDLSAMGRTSARSHTVPLPALGSGDGGDLTVGVRNDGAEAGDVKVVALVRAARVRLQKLDFSFRRLGASAGDGSAASKTVTSAGDIVAIDDPSSDIDGAGVQVPAGALPIPTRISVTSAADLPPDSGRQPGGPAVEFGPAGLQFVMGAAFITLPLNVSALPAGTQASDILVIKVSADGTRISIDPDDGDVNLAAGTVTVPTTSFSTFQANVPPGPPTINGRDFWLVSIGAEIRDDPGQQSDSRDRGFFGEIGSMSVRGKDGVPDAVSFDPLEKDVQFSHDDAALGSVDTEVFFGESPSASWSYSFDGQTILLDEGREEPRIPLSISKDGAFLIHAATDTNPGQNEAFMDILVQRSRNPPTMASLAGTYWVAGVELEANERGPGPLSLAGTRFFGTITMNARGTFAATTTDSFKEYDPGDGSYDTGKGIDRSRGTWTVQTGDSSFVGTVELVANDAEEGELVRLCPSKDRSMMVGFSEEDGPLIHALLLIRKSANLRASSLARTYSAAGFGIEDLGTYSIGTSGGPVDVPDFRTFSGAGKLVIGGGDIALKDFTEIGILRDPTASPGGVRILTDGPFDDPPAKLTVARTGKLSFSEDELRIVGAVTPNGMFGFFLDAPGPASDFFGWDVFVYPPPPSDADEQ